MIDRVLPTARKAKAALSPRGTLLAGCALALCGAGILARSFIPAGPEAPRLVAVPVALAPGREAPALVVVPPAADAAGTAQRDPLAIDLARLAARIAQERTAAPPPAAVARNLVSIAPAAPRPAAATPGPRLTPPGALAAFDGPDSVPRGLPATPLPEFRLAPEADMAAIAAAPQLPLAGESPLAAPRPLPARAQVAPPLRPEPPVAVAAAPGLAGSLLPRPRPPGLATAAAASLATPPAPAAARVPEPAPEPVLAAAPAPRAAAAPRAADPVLGPRVADAGACRKALARSMPQRKSSSPGGNAFFASLGGLSGTERDARIVAELARGNMPSALRSLHPVRLTGTDAAGQPVEIVVCVTPDYLALGSDGDHVRVPLGLPAAREIAARFDMTLPTPRMVDAIWAQSDVRLAPAPMPAGPQMSSTDYFLRHNATIEGQLGRKGGLIAGHKKDVVLASRMQNAPGRVAIYGWHRRSGDPIQPVSTVHGATYSDYSHGIRLVARTAYVNGRAADLGELLASQRYAGILNSDGPLGRPVIQLASR